ncbi:MAG: hypothetical protein K5829_01385 [Treponema sp.]|nr:hypothetical protein [Treponema sp.]
MVVWRNVTDDGQAYYTYFNISEEPFEITISADSNIRDLWERKDIGKTIIFKLEPHVCRALGMKFNCEGKSFTACKYSISRKF